MSALLSRWASARWELLVRWWWVWLLVAASAVALGAIAVSRRGR